VWFAKKQKRRLRSKETKGEAEPGPGQVTVKGVFSAHELAGESTARPRTYKEKKCRDSKGREGMRK
jgi:hypothetical protein